MTDTPSLRDRIAQALLARIKQATVPNLTSQRGSHTSLLAANEYDLADAVLAVLPATTDQTTEPAGTHDERQERYAVAIHDAMEPDLSLVDQEPAYQALIARAAEAAVALADAEQPTDLATSPVCICGHPEARHFEDACQTCGCGDYLEPQDAAEVIARWRRAALQTPADRAAVLREEADRIDATRAQFPIAVQNGITWATAELRRHAAEMETIETEAPDVAWHILTRQRGTW